ncbi:MAG: biotin--[acetyl-CoA-carboxylase] ligase [Gemmatimonadota bacterium]|nr:MAG: biotin--[acetyl-CoA-carboxylase] ligase [Gemmatimonadota bacterium]
MIVFTDSIEHAELVMTGNRAWRRSVPSGLATAGLQRLWEATYGTRAIRQSKLEAARRWSYLFLVESAAVSHYDLLIDLSRQGDGLPDGLICLAGSGEGFHGFKGRAWSAPKGNLYVAVHLTPQRRLEHSSTCFTVLAAVSVLDAIDRVPGLDCAAGIKWVNDILISGAKVGGVLAYTQSESEVITDVVLGIGLNVETTPPVTPTPFVPRVGALREAAPDPGECQLPRVFQTLVQTMSDNYEELLEGRYAGLLDRYRRRSLVVGREITLCSEKSRSARDILAVGRVQSLSDDLELVLDGYDRPFSRGRLVLDREY